MTSLDPTMPIGKQVAESLRKHNKVSKKEGQKAALELLKLVGIPEAEETYQQLSASVLRRSASTDRDRDCTGMLSGNPDC